MSNSTIERTIEKSPLGTAFQVEDGWRAKLACKDVGRSKELPGK